MIGLPCNIVMNEFLKSETDFAHTESLQVAELVVVSGGFFLPEYLSQSNNISLTGRAFTLGVIK